MFREMSGKQDSLFFYENPGIGVLRAWIPGWDDQDVQNYW